VVVITELLTLEAMSLTRIRPPEVICPHCKVRMTEKTDKAPVIFLSTRTKIAVYKCPSCGAETERQMAI
jgi:DNA-directed RNA polymerase subunit RPC12/RpoP